MFKSINGITPTYLSERIAMTFDVNGYDTRGSDMELWTPPSPTSPSPRAYRNSFMYMSGKLYVTFPSLYKILQILNHLSVIINCTNCSLAPD